MDNRYPVIYFVYAIKRVVCLSAVLANYFKSTNRTASYMNVFLIGFVFVRHIVLKWLVLPSFFSFHFCMLPLYPLYLAIGIVLCACLCVLVYVYVWNVDVDVAQKSWLQYFGKGTADPKTASWNRPAMSWTPQHHTSRSNISMGREV